MGFMQEPSADLRETASAMRQFYVALMNEGFTEDQAMQLVREVINANAQGGGEPK
jgi:hypothetical protein